MEVAALVGEIRRRKRRLSGRTSICCQALIIKNSLRMLSESRRPALTPTITRASFLAP